MFFAYFRVSHKKNIKRSPNGMNIQERDFRNERDPEDLDPTSRHQPGHEVGGHAYPLGAPSTLVGPSLLHRRTSSSYIYPYTLETSYTEPKTLFPPPQPSIPVRSHLGAFFGAPPEGESIMEGFYIITKASPMSCEQFTKDLWVHSYSLDGFFSLSL